MTTLQAGSRWCCFILLLFFRLQAYTQTDIKGRVVDEKDNMPLAGASVYFNNTTVGTYTSVEGDFHFEGIRMLNTEMVIYAPGYEVLVYKPTPKQIEGKRIVFKLVTKASSPLNKLELDYIDREKYLAIFRQFFLGVTEEGYRSTIFNENAISITAGESKTIFRIYSDTPLVIVNTMLGYKINFNLEEFGFDEGTGKNYFFGYARYEELGGSKKYNKNRERCYYGSTLHFYRSLVNHDLYKQGYGTFLMKPVKDTAVAGLEIGGVFIPASDSMLIEPVSAQDLLFIDSTNEISIQVQGKLLVQYNKNPSSKFFLFENGFLEDFQSKGVESYIHFKKSPVGINYKGVLDDYSNIEYSGYWMYEKVANTLPLNYQPLNSR